MIIGFNAVFNIGRILMPNLRSPPCGRKTVGRTVDHVNLTGVHDIQSVFKRHTDGEVIVKTAAVEVPCGQRKAE